VAWHATTVTGDTSWTEVFTSVFEGPASAVQARIWAETYGDDYPAELDPYSFTTWSELRRVVDALGLARGDLLIDVGCGRGGPGLWVASATGASLLGVDLRGADLADADLRDADLSRAELIGADLRDARLDGADLREAIYLTQPQVNAASGDARTRLPETLDRPGHWR